MAQTINPETGDLIHAQAVFEFFNGAMPDDIASQKAGRPVYKDCEMLRIRWQGDTKKELVCPANDRSDRPVINREDNSRFYPKWKDHPDLQKAYEAFKKGQAMALTGTPVDEAPFLTVAQRMELKAVSIYTVEGLAKLDPSTKIGSGFGDLRRKAQSYLERAAGTAVDAKHEEERQAMQAEMSAMRQQIDALLSGQPAPTPTPRQKEGRIEVAPPSPFDSLSDDELRGWLTDANKEAPHNRCGRATLLKMAMATNERLKREAEGRVEAVAA